MRKVLTCYFTSQPDEQRDGSFWPAEPASMRGLFDSVPNDLLHVFHDCFTDNQLPVSSQHVSISDSPYVARWRVYADYLRAHTELTYVWLVDATDVRMLKDPFGHMERGVLYAGCEPLTLGANRWVWDHAPCGLCRGWIGMYATMKILSPGVVGGDRKTMLAVVEQVVKLWEQHKGDPLQEFLFFNMAARLQPHITTGLQVCTEYKTYQPNSTSWWQHK